MAQVGITLSTDTSVTKLTLTKKLDVKTYLKSDGTYGGGKSFDPTYEFSIEGMGDVATANVGSSLSSVNTLTGVVIVDKASVTAKGDDFRSYKISGKAFPGATVS